MSISAQDLGVAVREARETLGLSRREVTEQSGIGKTALYDLEHGNPGVRLNTLIAALDSLGLDLTLCQRGASRDSRTAPSRSAPPPHPARRTPPAREAAPADPLPDHLL